MEEGGEEGEELEISEEERRFLRSRRRNFLMTWSWFEPLKAEQALPQGNTWVWLSSATPQSLATLTSCIVGIFYPEFLNFIPLWPRPHNWIVMQEDICTWALHKRETTNPLVSLSLNLLRGTLTFIFGILKPLLLPLKRAWEGQEDLQFTCLFSLECEPLNQHQTHRDQRAVYELIYIYIYIYDANQGWQHIYITWCHKKADVCTNQGS